MVHSGLGADRPVRLRDRRLVLPPQRQRQPGVRDGVAHGVGRGVPHVLDARTGEVGAAARCNAADGIVTVEFDLVAHGSALVAIVQAERESANVTATTADVALRRAGRLVVRSSSPGRYRATLGDGTVVMTSVPAPWHCPRGRRLATGPASDRATPTTSSGPSRRSGSGRGASCPRRASAVTRWSCTCHRTGSAPQPAFAAKPPRDVGLLGPVTLTPYADREVRA